MQDNFIRTKSAFNDDRLLKGVNNDDTLSQFSQPLANNMNPMAKSNRTGYLPKPPDSPKVEKDMLSKLDEVNSNVKNWLK